MKGVIFTHTAIGQDGRSITVYKFRSMKGEIDPERNAEISLSGLLDDTDRVRLTHIGRIIRPLGLDETPQIINLLFRRDMQLIGIRPFLPEEFALLPEHVRNELMREKPGFIPAESYYDYVSGDLSSRIKAIEKYVTDKPGGIKRVWVGLMSLIKRLIKHSRR